MTTQEATGWWRSMAGGLPRPFWFLFAGTLVNRFGYFVGPFLTLYLVRERGLAATAAGAIVAGFGFGALVSQPLGGWLADRVGRRRTLVIGMVATAATYVALGAARSLWLVAVCALLAGLATDIYRPAVGALVADLVPAPERRRAYGLLYWAINLGVGVSAVVGGALAERAFGLLFVLDAAACLGFAAVVLAAVPETFAVGTTRDGGFRTALRDPLLVALTVSSFAAATVYLQWIVTLPLAMGFDGLDARAYGLVAAVNPVVIVVGQPVVMRLLRDREPLWVYAVSGLLAALGFGLTAFADTILGYAVTVALWTLGEIALNIAAPVLLAAIAPPEMRGRYQGVWGSSWGMGLFAAPLLGTWALRLGTWPLWLGCAVVAAAATLCVLLLRNPLRERESALKGDDSGSVGV